MERNELIAKVRSSLETLCARGEYCSKDIFEKALRRLDGDEQGAREILSSLQGEGYQDDSRYAAAFAREKAAITGWGTIKISAALRQKGIEPDIIKEALLEIDAPKAEDKLLHLLQTKAKSLRDDPQARLKLIRFALSRGYEYSGVKPLLDEAFEDLNQSSYK